MPTTPKTRTLAGFVAAHVPLAAYRAAARLRRLARRWHERREEARALAQIELLDALALRDLALARSEWPSVFAEARRDVDLTRRRIAGRL
jgi:uncharacterized protein YjiS (DUF1127 family)